MTRRLPQLFARTIVCVCLCLSAAGAAAQEEWYSVQVGDTIESIATQFGISAESIIERNGLAQASPIVVDQILIIPVAEEAAIGRVASGVSVAGNAERTHIVQRGETLQVIAQRYGLSWQTLARANNIANPNLIYAGQALIVPASSQPDATPVLIPTAQPALPLQRPVQGLTSQRQFPVHIVQAGESIERIAQRSGVNPDALRQLNKFDIGTGLYGGDVILIPASSSSPPVVATPAPAADAIQHVVQRGETLAIIAARYGRTVAQIASANGILNPNRINVGQILIIS
ncbi:MAG: LysM peptidoglycan-binding domain-containing protein [Chloroflexi bacterium]|nr:LysM peptidoglycan-binding domain-containing protein [Chloroflexota bacterium]